ncbi:MAG: hypothetical protein M0R40_07170 [Firmicutes bacterium]|nr:hypothetical protein [Bacillota bacterium]
MKKKEFDNEMDYRISRYLAKSLYQNGSFTFTEYCRALEKLYKIYKPPISRLCFYKTKYGKAHRVWQKSEK